MSTGPAKATSSARTACWAAEPRSSSGRPTGGLQEGRRARGHRHPGHPATHRIPVSLEVFAEAVQEVSFLKRPDNIVPYLGANHRVGDNKPRLQDDANRGALDDACAAIGLRIQRYGPAITKRLGIAAGSGVPFPRADITTADQMPRALASTRTPTPTGPATEGKGIATAQRCSKNAMPSGTIVRKNPQKRTI